MNQERPKSVHTNQEQITSDEELFDTAKVNIKKLDKMTEAKIVEAIITFGEALSDTTLYKYEREFAERIVWSLVLNDGATITILVARQGGKSHTNSVVAPSVTIMLPLFAEYMEQFHINSHILKFGKGFWTGIYGPDYDRAAIIGNRINGVLGSPRAKMILSEPEIGMTFPERLSNFTGKLPRNSHINIKSANKKVSIEGDTYHLVITDETQEISDYVLKKSISPFLASTNGTTVHIGSAYPKRVYFYDVCKLNKEEDLKRAKKKQCHFEYPYQVVQKYNKNYKKYIEREKKKLGEMSEEFRMSYELFWPLEQGMFVTEDFLTSHLAKPYGATPFDKTNDHVIGIDIGKSKDSTVITVLEVDWENPIVVDPESQIVRRMKKIKNWYEISGDNYDNQFDQICSFIDNYKWSRLVCDATGVGAPMYDRLYNKYNKKGKTVTPFVFTRPDKSYGYSLLYKELLSERVQYPNTDKARSLKKHKKFVEQMSNLSKEIEGGYLIVKHTSEKGHDDYPDSLMLAVFGAEESIEGVEAEETIENIYKVEANIRNTIGNNFWKSRN